MVVQTQDQRKLAMLAAWLYITNKRKKRINRKTWVNQWLGDHQRISYGFASVLDPLLQQSSMEYRNYVRMEPRTYKALLGMITPLITKQNTNMRLTLTPHEKLSITLSYLAEGLPMRRLSYEYRVGISTAREAIMEVMQAIINVLSRDYLRFPTGEAEWNLIMKQFYDKWNFPACIGALDGKHIHLYPPPNSGSFYYNYKEGFSIVLLALVDAEYKFIGVDIGANGKACDAGIWSGSDLRAAVNNMNGVPEIVQLPNSELVSPPVILADSGFGLETNLMRPYVERGITNEQRVFNYRLSRARRVSENAFGILANRWRILLNKANLSPDRATVMVQTCCLLHNFLLSEKAADLNYLTPGLLDEALPTGEFVPGLWRNDEALEPLRPQADRNPTFQAKLVRDNFKYYFQNEGELSWQNSRIGVL